MLKMRNLREPWTTCQIGKAPAAKFYSSRLRMRLLRSCNFICSLVVSINPLQWNKPLQVNSSKCAGYTLQHFLPCIKTGESFRMSPHSLLLFFLRGFKELRPLRNLLVQREHAIVLKESTNLILPSWFFTQVWSPFLLLLKTICFLLVSGGL